MSLLRKDRHQLAHGLGFHGFLVSLPAGSTLPDNKPTNLPTASHSPLSSQSGVITTPGRKSRKSAEAKGKIKGNAGPTTLQNIIDMKKYHYEFVAYTDNLNYGRMFLGQAKTKAEATHIARTANKGCFVIEKHRIYN